MTDYCIISRLNKYSGFFSMFFFFVNHYIHAKKNNWDFQLNCDDWLFKAFNGWEDYFENIEIVRNLENEPRKITAELNKTFIEYSIEEYKNVLPEIYRYNDRIKALIEKRKKNLKLKKYNYSAIFIRRGDKLLSESSYIHGEVYLKKLLELNPSCKTVYLQTDDYTCFNEINDYIKKEKLNIKLLTMCEENCKGIIAFSYHKNSIINEENYSIDKNVEYLKNNKESFADSKPVDQMNREEIYLHTIKMIIGIELVLQSNLVVTDYSSNVARFIKLMHADGDCVYDVITDTNELDYEKVICPSWGF